VSRRLLLLLLFIVVASTLLFVPLPIPGTYAGRTIENAGHTPLFLIGTLFVLGILRHDYRLEGARLYALAGAICAGAGLLSEVIQRPLRRDASWEDVFEDVVGVVCALALHAAFDRRSRLTGVARGASLLIALSCLAVYLTPMINMTRAYMHRNKQFPVLASFDSRVQQFWIVGYGINREIRDGALDVEFESRRWPGVSFFEPIPDWSRFKTLAIDVENPGDQVLHLGVRVHDAGRHRGRRYADRFNRNFELAAGERKVLQIPLADIRKGPRDRLMNMTQISDVTLFRSQETGSRRVRLHLMRLE
jgi:hypothetical protein